MLEIRIGEPTVGYLKDLGDDVFQRIDEKTGKATGFVVFNFKKRTKNFGLIDISLPFSLEINH